MLDRWRGRFDLDILGRFENIDWLFMDYGAGLELEQGEKLNTRRCMRAAERKEYLIQLP